MHSVRIVLALPILALACSTRGSGSLPNAHTPDALSLHLGRDSFVVRFSGLPDGFHIHEYVATPHGFRYSSVVRVGDVLVREAEVQLDSSMFVTLARSTTQIGARQGNSEMTYLGRRARGTAVPVQATVPGRVSIDTVLPPGAFDGLALYPVLLSQHWEVGDIDTLTILDADELSITRQVFHVVGLEGIDIGAVQTQALRAELSSTQLPVTLWFTESRPHRLLKVASASGESILVP